MPTETLFDPIELTCHSLFNIHHSPPSFHHKVTPSLYRNNNIQPPTLQNSGVKITSSIYVTYSKVEIPYVHAFHSWEEGGERGALHDPVVCIYAYYTCPTAYSVEQVWYINSETQLQQASSVACTTPVSPGSSTVANPFLPFNLY
jgi:hypothetical protein